MKTGLWAFVVNQDKVSAIFMSDHYSTFNKAPATRLIEDFREYILMNIAQFLVLLFGVSSIRHISFVYMVFPRNLNLGLHTPQINCSSFALIDVSVAGTR